ncbi:MAG: DUF4143 domain-containing protein [Stomatobaculum sp.]
MYLHYSYVQVAYTILASKETEDREYKSLEAIKGDNYPKYVATTDKMMQERNGIRHINIFYLHPYSNNLLKRLVKTPKLYFYDTGLVCYLTKWTSAAVLESGAIQSICIKR